MNYWGTTISNDLEEVEGKNSKDIATKREAILAGYLEKSDGPRKGQFADPALMFS